MCFNWRTGGWNVRAKSRCRLILSNICFRSRKNSILFVSPLFPEVDGVAPGADAKYGRGTILRKPSLMANNMRETVGLITGIMMVS